MRLTAKELAIVRTIASWPIRSSKRCGRYLRARTRYGEPADADVAAGNSLVNSVSLIGRQREIGDAGQRQRRSSCKAREASVSQDGPEGAQPAPFETRLRRSSGRGLALGLRARTGSIPFVRRSGRETGAKVGGWTKTRPVSLGLLPSGPDPVGERYVLRQPPGAYVDYRACRRKWPYASSGERARTRQDAALLKTGRSPRLAHQARHRKDKGDGRSAERRTRR